MAESPSAAAPPALRASREETRFLFVANAGPKLGDTESALRDVFGAFGDVDDVRVPDRAIAQCLVTMRTRDAARAAREATHKRPCLALGNRALWVTFARDPTDANPKKKGSRSGRRNEVGAFVLDDAAARVAAARAKQEAEMCVAVTTSDALNALGVKGATLVTEFVTEQEEAEILAFLDEETPTGGKKASGDARRGEAIRWQRLAKRRVAHFGFAFDYGTRDASERAENSPDGALPGFCRTILDRLRAARDASAFGEEEETRKTNGFERATRCDQLTVNEYPAGVGLAPHVDTHSAFGPVIFSLSLAGNAVMEFRRLDGEEAGAGERDPKEETKPIRVVERHAIALPRRSMLALAAEARYEWQHYIPHRKRDVVLDSHLLNTSVPRAPRRVSLTFRERRDVAVHGPCDCFWPNACDSRRGAAQRLKRRARPGLVAKATRDGDAMEGTDDEQSRSIDV